MTKNDLNEIIDFAKVCDLMDKPFMEVVTKNLKFIIFLLVQIKKIKSKLTKSLDVNLKLN